MSKNDRFLPDSIITNTELLKTENENTNKVLINTLLDITAQITFNGITCTQLGMVPDNPDEGAKNFTKLVNAMQAGAKILVDDKYYINALSSRPTITKDIIWEGINSRAGFVLKGATYFFDISVDCKLIDIRGVKFTTESGDPGKVLFYSSGKPIYLEKILFNRIVTKGDMSLARLYFPKNLNPEEIKYGVGIFEFSQSEIHDTHMSFTILVDCPCEKYHIWGNNVSNFDFEGFNFGVNNDHAYGNQVIAAHKVLLVHDNIVINDDSWWGGSGSGSYYCFVLFEGQKAIWHHNHVEGIKTTYVRAVYDCYLSANEVEYNNNIWKNNICFNAGKSYNTLMKAKGGGGIKRYIDNHFICEKEYAERLGQSPDLLKVQFYESTSRARRWEISNNTIDVYHLSCPASSVKCDEIWIQNNDITCEHLDYNILIYGIYSDEFNPYDYEKVVHKVNNNNIRIRGTGKICLVKNGTYDPKVDISACPSVEVKGNYIESYEASYLLYQLHAKNIELCDNTINITSPIPITEWGLIYDSYWESYKNLHNVIQQPNSRCYTHRSPFNKYILEDFIINDIGGVSGNDSIILPNNSVDKFKYRYTRHYEIESAVGETSFDLKFEHYYDPVSAYNYISFINAKDISVKYRIAKTGDTSGEGSNDNPKLVGTSSGYTVRFYNTTSGSPMFYFSGWPANPKTTHITTRTVVIGKFHINQDRDVLRFTSDLGGPVAIDIDDGIYDGYQLADALQKAMNADPVLSGNGKIKFKVTWDIASQYFIIDAGVGHTIAYMHSGSDAGTIFGFNSNIPAAQSIKSQVACG
jgi:hypothetical protein